MYDICQEGNSHLSIPHRSIEREVTFCVRGVVSPLLANGSLHYVFDCWVDAWRKTVATGDVIVVRYADDLVVGFQHRADAERFLGEFRERLATFGLELSAEKTRLIQFGRFAALNRKERGQGKPETFTFLGFTHYCGTRRSTGSFIVWRKTAKKRMAAKLQALKVELRRRMHEPLSRVGEWVQKVLTGYYQYHAIPGNLDRLSVFRHRLRRLWRTVLRRRSQRGRMNWLRLSRKLDRWTPSPRVLHPYPAQRFAASHPR
jgi:RNA-directed DNA polymerase